MLCSEGVAPYLVFVWETSLYFRSTGLVSLCGVGFNADSSEVLSREGGFGRNQVFWYVAVSWEMICGMIRGILQPTFPWLVWCKGL